MVRRTSSLIPTLWLGAAVGQTLSSSGTEFEVYDVKLNKSGMTKGDYFTIEGSTFRAHGARLSDLFQYAFKVRRDVISGTPPWFDSDRLDIAAKAAPTTSPEELRMMLQSLLIKECKIVMHSELKRMSAFALLVGKAGIKMQTSTAAGRADCEHLADRGPGVIHLMETSFRWAFRRLGWLSSVRGTSQGYDASCQGVKYRAARNRAAVRISRFAPA
jgi:uncharacterized protein (TIGR03435 family)